MSSSGFFTDPGGTIYACGMFPDMASGEKSSFPTISRFDNGEWETLIALQSVGVGSFVINSKGDVFARGSFPSNDDEEITYDIARWNGSDWTGLVTRPYASWLSCIGIDSSDNLYAGGRFKTFSDQDIECIAKWDGTAWSPVGEGIQFREQTSNVVAIMSDLYGNIYAGGSFDSAGKVPATNIAMWDGTSWSALGEGVDGMVRCMALDKSGNVYAAGDFNVAGDVPVDHIAMWDGVQWHALDNIGETNRNAYFSSLVFDASGNLYGGGSFYSIDGVAANNIAKWDGANWSALGSGTNSEVEELAVDNQGRLFVRGSFTMAGGKACAGFAMCNLNSEKVLSPTSSGIFRPIFEFNRHTRVLHLKVKKPAFVSLKIYSLTGRLVYEWSDYLSEGLHTHGIGQALSSSGTYAAAIQAGTASFRFPVVICR